MFERFVQTFSVSSHFPQKATEQLKMPLLLSQASGAVEFFFKFEGSTFSNGLYRVHSLREMSKWTRTVEKFFPQFQGRISCFSYDWLGRQFALDSNLVLNGEPLVIMFDLGADQVLKSQTTFYDFHNLNMVDYPNEILEYDLFAQWKSIVKDDIQIHQCVGYKVPLFLSGNHELSNLEITNINVYWGLFGQILAQVRKLPPGTPISQIKIRE